MELSDNLAILVLASYDSIEAFNLYVVPATAALLQNPWEISPQPPYLECITGKLPYTSKETKNLFILVKASGVVMSWEVQSPMEKINSLIWLVSNLKLSWRNCMIGRCLYGAHSSCCVSHVRANLMNFIRFLLVRSDKDWFWKISALVLCIFSKLSFS
ncbi:hypothetical protein WICPIJ_001094 [Wickerhamomyces pijperi]|uniref:Uncharacterized protein n=1 Tax=Wickerhamomyces pijperi TaxID=599730 RepID=A0A9P8QBL2_WICPI|nr:hypothetical protein WICPIJ_001094 [Wickerhamomyces pijperi]